tara:strand:- start:309 stop:578 length:270 start_codon:yes stop_codon:yes gene_type:complete
MKPFVIKALIASIIFYILFEITIGSRLNKVQNFFDLGKDKAGKIKIKNKILKELEKANNKEFILDTSERKIISTFLEKINKELALEKGN